MSLERDLADKAKEDATARAVAAEKAGKEAEERCQDVESQLFKERVRSRELSEQLDDVNVTVENLKCELSPKEQKDDDEKEKDESVADENEVLKRQLEAAKARIDDFEKKLAATKEESDGRIRELEEEKVRLEEELSSSQEISAAEVKSSGDALKDLEVEKSALTDINLSLEEKVKEAHLREEEQILHNTSLKAELNVETEERQRLERELEAVRSEFAATSASSVETSGKQLAALQEEIDGCLKKMVEEKERFAGEEASFAEARQRWEEERVESAAREETLALDLEKSKEALVSLSEELGSAKALVEDSQETSAALESLEQQLQVERNRVAKLESEANVKEELLQTAVNKESRLEETSRHSEKELELAAAKSREFEAAAVQREEELIALREQMSAKDAQIAEERKKVVDLLEHQRQQKEDGGWLEEKKQMVEVLNEKTREVSVVKSENAKLLQTTADAQVKLDSLQKEMEQDKVRTNSN